MGITSANQCNDTATTVKSPALSFFSAAPQPSSSSEGTHLNYNVNQMVALLHSFRPMPTKRAFLRLLTAILGLLASVLELLTATVRLGAALLERITPRSATVPVAVAAPRAVTKTVCQTPLALGPTPEEKLQGALLGLKFPAARVRVFTETVRGRTEVEPLEVLVREGIVALNAN